MTNSKHWGEKIFFTSEDSMLVILWSELISDFINDHSS